MNEEEKIKHSREVVEKARQNQWSTSLRVRYNDAVKMCKELNAVDGIVANITVGGCSISCGVFESEMKRICKKYGGVPTRGMTMMQENTILRNKPVLDETEIKITDSLDVMSKKLQKQLKFNKKNNPDS